MEVAELAPRREVVASWDPDAVRIDATWIGDGASVLDSRAAAIDRSRVDLREAWQGAAGDAAVDRLGRDLAAAQRRTTQLRVLERAVRDGASAIAVAREALLDAVVVAEADGCLVAPDWSVVSNGVSHTGVIAAHVQALIDADESAARSIDDASAALLDGEPRHFVPLALGLAWAVEAAVHAMIAAGVLSVGAMAFALVDRFGIDAWDAIHDALPTSFFQDAGPVDAAGVEKVLADETEQGRQRAVRQVDSGDDVRTLFDDLAQEGQAASTGGNEKILERYVLPDGTMIQLRVGSKSGGPVIDIQRPGGGDVIKVHVR
ncbi:MULTISPECIES: hypothetical protein [unclassified Rhodococcus (in: high G+C Gram-positive bacteria)]|uniref:hypothetical protein n=1 Tax=unclassified Rhodococcus (in: high G+C Gram-positive bacteria) TaxID=192944 RepID=UPI0006FC2E87|nr:MULTISPECIES: hypothetical protein [unclassified Rhodococcus (in: high G+C Gram-positive bacteria)]KQU36545.1 hypothetical protein ASG69_20240 [Rhodococcus sp. Leaf225]KQU47578.1 hypothetical protein ASH03_21620 [Rhodococcus sp. Leaf258]